MSILKRLTTTALLLLLLAPALLQAEEEEPRWYQVEVIIFAQNNPAYRDSELWPLDYTLPELEGSIELIPDESGREGKEATPMPTPFSLLAAEELQLGDAASRIERASDVELLLHLGWRQPGLPEERAQAVHIYEGMLQPQGEEPQQGEVMERPQQLPRLDGTLRLILSRYLHLESDLVWRKELPSYLAGMLPVEEEASPTSSVVTDGSSEGMLQGELMGGEAAQEEASAAGYQVFRLQQSRRMRSDEIHYIDHPLFGIIAQVSRYELPKAEAAAETATPQN